MAEIRQQYVFSYQEVAEALIKKQNLHEGIWAIYLEFALGAANIQGPEGIMPAAIVPLVKVGLQKAEAVSAIAVDAAVVNPPKETRISFKKKSSS